MLQRVDRTRVGPGGLQPTNIRSDLSKDGRDAPSPKSGRPISDFTATKTLGGTNLPSNAQKKSHAPLTSICDIYLDLVLFLLPLVRSVTRMLLSIAAYPRYKRQSRSNSDYIPCPSFFTLSLLLRRYRSCTLFYRILLRLLLNLRYSHGKFSEPWI